MLLWIFLNIKSRDIISTRRIRPTLPVSFLSFVTTLISHMNLMKGSLEGMKRQKLFHLLRIIYAKNSPEKIKNMVGGRRKKCWRGMWRFHSLPLFQARTSSLVYLWCFIYTFKKILLTASVQNNFYIFFNRRLSPWACRCWLWRLSR